MTTIISSKEKALRLRKQGKSYNEINRLLGVPKSTLSTWLKEIPLSRQVRKKNISQAKIIWAKNITAFNKKRSLINQQSKNKEIDQFAKDIKDLDKKALFWLGLGLFLAEGGKREKWSVRFVNSDSDIIKIMMRFYREICLVPDDKFRFRIYLHPNINDQEAKSAWSKILKVSNNQFYKSQEVISQSSQRKRNSNRLPIGTLHIYINDVKQMNKIKGWIKGLFLKI